MNFQAPKLPAYDQQYGCVLNNALGELSERCPKHFRREFGTGFVLWVRDSGCYFSQSVTQIGKDRAPEEAVLMWMADFIGSVWTWSFDSEIGDFMKQPMCFFNWHQVPKVFIRAYEIQYGILDSPCDFERKALPARCEVLA